LNPRKQRQELEKAARSAGAALFGVADLGAAEDRTGEVSLEGLSTGISVGYRLSDVVLDGIVDHPTRTYQYHYRQVNLLLDRIGLRLTSMIQEQGYRVFPVPASQIVDWDRCVGHISHKMVGNLAGLGWVGKNNLLINPDYGARVRYVSILTDMPLPPDGPLGYRCGACRRCVDVCPGGAVGERPEAFNLDSCVETINLVRKQANIGSRICGICVRACTGRL
jgi:epoxyqueuosine reductase QueG